MAHENSASYNFLEGLRKNWVIIFFVGSLIIGWSDIGSRVSAVEKRVDKVEQLVETQQKTLNDLSGAIIEIKANYLFIKEKLEKLDK